MYYENNYQEDRVLYKISKNKLLIKLKKGIFFLKYTTPYLYFKFSKNLFCEVLNHLILICELNVSLS